MILYAITDNMLTPPSTICAQVEQALKGGAKYVQFRDKTLEYKQSLDIACRLRDLCNSYGAKLIINDNIALAKDSHAHGVHLGKDDDGVKKAIDILGQGAIIGASCYGDILLAVRAKEHGATYAAFGACFASPTKPNAPTISLDVIIKAKKELDLPICAIGGIKKENAHLLKQAGADMIAVISALWTSSDIYMSARGLVV